MSNARCLSRRDFLHSAGSFGLLGSAAAAFAQPADQQFPRSRIAPRPNKPAKKLAVVTTAYYYLSHAYHICGRFLEGYSARWQAHYPDFGIAGMFVEQQKENDLSRAMAKKHGFTLYPDVAGAMTLGSGKLAVDGVLLIGEHGDYAYNAKGQKLYPRFELFQKIVEVFRLQKAQRAGVQRQAPVLPLGGRQADGGNGPRAGLPSHGRARACRSPGGGRSWSCRSEQK